ncbi:hypothetical protein Bca4012_045348 [Brassica carinata]
MFKFLLLLPDEAKKVHSLRYKIGIDDSKSHLLRFSKQWSCLLEEHSLGSMPILSVTLS